MECLLNITNTLRDSCSYVEMVPKRLKRQNFEGFKLIRLHSGQNKSGDLQRYMESYSRIHWSVVL